MSIQDTPGGKVVVVIHETWAESIVADLVSLGLTAALIGLGVYLESTAMQWFGFVVAALKIMGAAQRILQGVTTPQKAADYIRDRWGAVSTLPTQERG